MNELGGKTIKHAFQRWDGVRLVFTDGTAVEIESDGGYEGAVAVELRTAEERRRDAAGEQGRRERARRNRLFFAARAAEQHRYAESVRKGEDAQARWPGYRSFSVGPAA